MDIKTLVKLTSRAWSLNILSLMHDGTPGRQASLLAATAASRTAFAASLENLVSLGFIERNPDHGHPLRPEFRLTDQGKIAAQVAKRIVSLVPSDEEFTLLRRSWTVPVLALIEEPQRFSHLRTSLISITDRALSGTLQQLEERQWVDRHLVTSVRTPYPIYGAINRGQEITRAINLASGPS